jgi:hypothetical protein
MYIPKEQNMNLIDRYVHEVGRHLPRKNRADIMAELRSSLVDTLEDTYEDPTEDQIKELLREFGSPKSVAASYYPEGQYLIGPTLYPIFRLVVSITLAAVVGAQLLAWVLAVAIGREPFSALDALAGLVNSIPASLGWVVLVFMILRWFDVEPESEQEAWSPDDLPVSLEKEEVKRGELIAGVVFSIIILVLISFFPDSIGFVTTPGWTFYANPVIGRYLGWIAVSLLAGIGLNIYLIWQGRWTLLTRILKIGVNLLSIVVLALLIQGHTAWLVEQDAAGFFMTLEKLPEMLEEGFQLIGMHAFRMAFVVALVVTVIETLVLIYRLIKRHFFSREDFGVIQT